jgi:carbon monoxide dehydrogenase subunit G
MLPTVPRRTFSHSVLIDAPRERVWAALQIPETWEAIPGVDRVHDPVIDGEGRLEGFSFEAIAAGETYPGLATPETREEGEIIAWAIDTPEIEGTIRVDLEDSGAGTKCAVTIEVESRTILSSVLFPAIASAIGKGLPSAVEDFAREIGAGDPPSS